MSFYKIYLKFFLFISVVLKGSLNVYASNKIEINEEYKLWPPQIVKWKISEGKNITIIATHHTDDINSPIHKRIEDTFDDEQPDVYVMEGFSSEREGVSPERLKKKSRQIYEQTGKCGENLYAAYLATKRNITFIGAELTEEKQLEPMARKGFSFQDIVFYMLVQHLPYFFREGDFETHTVEFNQSTWESMSNHFLKEIISRWLNREVALTYQDFLKWWDDNFLTPLDMQKEFGDWLQGTSYSQPSINKDALHTQKIAYWWHRNRDEHFINIIKSSVSQYNKTLVIFGSHHLQELWKILIETYGQPISKKEIF